MRKLSPMMEQYKQIKENYPNCLLMFRLGDFYELFFDDAVIASKVLDIVLTGRDAGLDERVPMCGVPRHALDVYVSKLTEAGHKVAICEQASEGGAEKGLVRREVVRVVTPGTVLDESLLEVGRNNYIAFLSTVGESIGIAAADITTGEFLAYSVPKASCSTPDELARFNPAEVLCDEEMPADVHTARVILLEHFNVGNLKGFGIDDDDAAICAASGLLLYIRETQKIAPRHITGIKLYKSSEYLVIDSSSRRNLEITESIREGKKEGSLLWVLDNTVTAMGARALRRWVLEPLTGISKIETRLSAVEELVGSSSIEAIRERLAQVPDIERILGRVTYSRASARDLQAFKRGLACLPEIVRLLAPFKSTFLSYFHNETDCLADIYELLQVALSEEGSIREGYNAELDGFRGVKADTRKKFEKLEAGEKQRLGIKGLKIAYNKVFGYYIEVTDSFRHMIPPNYKRVQTLSGRERYATSELKELEETILSAEEKITSLEQALLRGITERIGAEAGRVLHTGNALAVIDCLQSLASVAIENRYVRPKLNRDGRVNVKNGRHPVVERALGGFVPNDIIMNMETDRLLTITGPNMAGKSTFMRQAALIFVMAQMGSFVPADFADIGIADRLFARVGAVDDLAKGQSTFMVEMSEVSAILDNATKNSLIVLDEIGRGTSTYDGMSIAWAVLEYIADKRCIGARTLFATHYHEMTALEGKACGVVNYHAAVSGTGRGSDITFTYKIERGFAGKSYGIHAARLAGLPAEVTDRAAEIMLELENKPKIEASKTVVYGTNRRIGYEGNRMTIREDG